VSAPDAELVGGAGLEPLYVGAALLRGRLPDLRLRPHEPVDPRAATLLGELLDRERRGLPLSLARVATDLPADVLAACGGPVFLAECFDAADEWRGSLELRVAEAAREIRETARLRIRQRAAEALGDPDADLANVRTLLREAEELLEEPQREESLDLADFGLTGEALEALRTTPDPPLVRPYLPPGLVGLVVLAGSPKAGKTTLSLELALQGAFAEDGIPALRSLVVCAERPAKQLDAVLRRLDANADRPRNRADWTRRIVISARGSKGAPRVDELLALDPKGLAALVGALHAARRDGDPFALLVLDSLSRLKPAELDEDSPSDMTPWLGELHRIAHSEGVCALLVHHARKGRAGAREGDGDPFDAIRGAGAILAVADVAIVLRRPAGSEGERYREILARGNCIPDWRGTFEVCGAGHEPGTLYRWRPIDRTAAPELADVLAVGEELTLAAVWRRATDANEGEQPGSVGYETVGRWLRTWGARVEVRKGPSNARLVRRAS